MNEDEIWKPVVGFEGLYEVSDTGKIRSVERNGTRKNGTLLTANKDKNGYMRVSLSKNGKTKKFFIHRLVYEAFNGPIPQGMQINHINENPTDNRFCNLNVMTPKENNNWGSHNKHISETKSKPVIAYDKQYRFIKEFRSFTEATKWLDIPNAHSNISKCCKGKIKTMYGYIWRYKE